VASRFPPRSIKGERDYASHAIPADENQRAVDKAQSFIPQRQAQGGGVPL
jgi:hypothetical protein